MLTLPYSSRMMMAKTSLEMKQEERLRSCKELNMCSKLVMQYTWNDLNEDASL